MKSAELRIFAGPNGSGKNTLMPAFGVVGKFINTGEIARVCGISLNAATKESDRQKYGCLGIGSTFTVKTVLESERTFELIEKAHAFDYRVTGIYIFTRNVEINLARVVMCAAAGKYCVPKEEVLDKYQKSLANLPAFVKACDNVTIVDASEKPIILYRKTDSGPYMITQGDWTEQAITSLLKEGKLPQSSLN